MIEQQVRDAIVAELERQAEASANKLKVERTKNDVKVSGEIRLDELVMAVMGSVAGGP
jgi:osmotically-inducible protein OsmY